VAPEEVAVEEEGLVLLGPQAHSETETQAGLLWRLNLMPG